MTTEHLRAAVASIAGHEVAAERWFGAKGAEVGELVLAGSLGPFDDEWLLAVHVADDTYLLPVAVRGDKVAPATGPLWRALAEACRTGSTLTGDGLELSGAAGPLLVDEVGIEARPLGIDQSNTSVVLGERFVLKCYRRLAPGEHPEIELTRQLCEHGFDRIPAVHGSATVRVEGETSGALLLQDYVADGRDGWLAAADELGRLLDAGDSAAAAVAPSTWAAATGEATAELHALLAETLGSRVAGLEEVRALYEHALAELEEALAVVPEPAHAQLAAAAPELRLRFGVFTEVSAPLLTRVHGDLHLGQFLRRDGAPPVLVDFEGEPTRGTVERRRDASPLRDLASLLRSVDHAAHWVCSDRGEAAGPVATAWIAAARSGIRDAYERRLSELDAPFAIDEPLLAAFEAEKAVYEFVYAVRFLPSWLVVPTRALASVVA